MPTSHTLLSLLSVTLLQAVSDMVDKLFIASKRWLDSYISVLSKTDGKVTSVMGFLDSSNTLKCA